MRGIKSQEMVLAASNSDHTKVELVDPPQSAAVGERVTFPGLEGEPDDVLNPKKKVWETIGPLDNSCNSAPARIAAASSSASIPIPAGNLLLLVKELPSLSEAILVCVPLTVSDCFPSPGTFEFENQT